MGERIGNWGSNCSEIRIASHAEGDWYVNYQMSQTKIMDVENAILDIQKKVNSFNTDIGTLKSYMKNTDFDQNLRDLLTGRLDAASATDKNFGENAKRAADYIRNNSRL